MKPRVQQPIAPDMRGDRDRLRCVAAFNTRAWARNSLQWVCGLPVHPENGLERADIVSGSVDSQDIQWGARHAVSERGLHFGREIGPEI